MCSRQQKLFVRAAGLLSAARPRPGKPGRDALGSSPLTLDVSNITQGYFVTQSDSADLVTSLQITAPTGVCLSYFIDPGENAVIPFTEGNGDYTVVGYQQIQGDQYAALYSEILTVELENDFLPVSFIQINM